MPIFFRENLGYNRKSQSNFVKGWAGMADTMTAKFSIASCFVFCFFARMLLFIKENILETITNKHQVTF